MSYIIDERGKWKIKDNFRILLKSDTSELYKQERELERQKQG